MRPFILLRLPIFFFVCFGASSCAYLLLPVLLPVMMVGSNAWRIDYEFEVAAERQDNGHKTSLQTRSPSAAPTPSPSPAFRDQKVDLVAGDDIASFSFNVRPGGIDCTVRNEGTEPLQLRLEDARFIGPDGAEQELYAAGAHNRGEPSSFLERGSETSIFLWPRDWLHGSYETKEVSREEYEQLDAANRGDIMYFELMLSNWETVPIPIQVAIPTGPFGRYLSDRQLPPEQRADMNDKEIAILQEQYYEQLDEDRRGGIRYYRRGESLLHTWIADSPLDGSQIAEKTKGGAERVAQHHLGQTLEIVLPLERDGYRHIYRFRFTVTALHPERMQWG